MGFYTSCWEQHETTHVAKFNLCHWWTRSPWGVLHWLLCKFIRRLLLVRVVHTRKTTELHEILLFKVPQHVLGSVNLISAFHFLKQPPQKREEKLVSWQRPTHYSSPPSPPRFVLLHLTLCRTIFVQKLFKNYLCNVWMHYQCFGFDCQFLSLLMVGENLTYTS